MRLKAYGKGVIQAIFGPEGTDPRKTNISKLISGMPEESKVYNITKMLQNLSRITEYQWGGYAFSRDVLDGKITLEEKYDYINKAIECGKKEAREIKDRYKFKNMEELAKNFGITIDTPNMPNGGGHVIFAQFVEPNYITVFMDTIKQAETTLKNPEVREIIGGVDAKEILLAHEIFHWIEYRGKKDLYTQTEKIELWRKPFSNRSRILCLGEIAGMAFAKELLDMKVSPFIFDVLFLYGYNKQAASALYEEIIEIAEEYV